VSGGQFDYFVLFAEMRTGSNFLEENLNEYPGIHCYGEVFNPHFIGHDRQTELFEMSLADRDNDPAALIRRMREHTQGLPGFRFFHDHDPRVLALCLKDRRCAKIILTRNPVDTYVSLEIVRQTGQWRLGDLQQAKTAQITFDAKEFGAHLAARQTFQLELQHALQTTGQTAFHIGYEDIPDIEVQNGLARFLGIDKVKDKTSKKTKKQNPAPLDQTVRNFAEMQVALANTDHFDLSRSPNFEPRRGPAVPGYVACSQSPLIFMPIKGGPVQAVCDWMAALDKSAVADLMSGFTQQSLRQWKRQHPGHRSFAVLRHPVARLHRTFVQHILLKSPDSFLEIRETLRTVHKLPLPEVSPDSGLDAGVHRAAFIGFAKFVAGNLAGQTSIRIDASWASQLNTLSGMTQFMPPDMIFREERLNDDLPYLAGVVGRTAPTFSPEPEFANFQLADIYDKQVEAAVRSAYQKDYVTFGFGKWRT